MPVTFFRHPVALRVQIDEEDKARLFALASEVGKPVGRVIGDLVAAQSGVLARRDALSRDGAASAVGGVNTSAAGIDRPGVQDRVSLEPAAGSAAGRRAPERVLL